MRLRKVLQEASSIDGGHEAEAPAKGGGKKRLMRLADLDGRTRARRAADQMLADLLSDMGGADRVSTAKRALAEHAAVLNAMACDQGARYLSGEPVDVTEFATTANALRRLLSDFGLERRARDVTPPLHDYIRGQA
jgi:hypothetical protein